MIDSEDYRAFTWIEQYVGTAYSTAILDPWKGTAFTAITGKNVFSRIAAHPRPADEDAYVFLQDGARDAILMANYGISIVYTQLGSDSRDLLRVREDVYLLRGVQE